MVFLLAILSVPNELMSSSTSVISLTVAATTASALSSEGVTSSSGFVALVSSSGFVALPSTSSLSQLMPTDLQRVPEAVAMIICRQDGQPGNSSTLNPIMTGVAVRAPNLLEGQ